MKFFVSSLMAVGVLLPCLCPAGPRSSANYDIPTETLDAGGLRSSSAAYTHDGSLGGIGGISVSPSEPLRTVKHSYIGQLFDPAALSLSTTSTNVNESETRQIAATLINDDATTQSVSPSQVAWTVLNGPIAGISPGGLLTAAVVYQDESALVRGSFLGRSGTLGFKVINTATDDFGTYAGDGLEDAWQVQFFGKDSPDACPGCDPDGDAQNNRFEYIAGTVPVDAASKFRLEVSLVPGQPTQRDIVFSPRLSTRSYEVQSAPDLGAALFTVLPGTTTSDFGQTRTVRDNNAVDGFRFYRVSISFP